MSDVVYRTAGAWGPGLGADLTAAQVDMNFWVLYSLIVSLQTAEPITIDSITLTGNQLFITMTDHYVFGPYTIPTATWNFTGPYAAGTSYAVNDVFTTESALWLVIYPNTAPETFSPYANDGSGHNYYAQLLGSPFGTGTAGQVLMWQNGSPAGFEPTNLTRNIAGYFEGAIGGSELLLQYLVPEAMTLPSGLPESLAYSGVLPTGSPVFNIYQNAALIGTVTITPTDVVWYFPTPVSFAPADIFSLVGPASPDATMQNVSFTFVATLP